ncbi:MAG: Cna B-type domain-containing protein [Clostridia bacterium]|nr:Cna B-type domain-containing protein [Clostridia bacterium]
MDRNRIKKIGFISIFMIAIMYVIVFRKSIFENFQRAPEQTGTSTLYDENQTMYVITLKYMYQNGTLADSKDVYAYAPGESIDIPVQQIDGYTSSIDSITETIDDGFISRIENLDYVDIAKQEGYNIYRIYYTITYIPAPSEYRVVHYLQNEDGTYTKHYEELFSENVYIGDEVSTNIIDYEGYTFNWDKSTYVTTVQKDGNTELGLYYDRNKRYIYLDSNGGTYYEPVASTYGTEIDLSSYTPTRDGYIFDGWSCIDKATGNVIESPDVMPDADVYYKANWTKINTTFTITYFVENPDDENYTNTGTYTVSNIQTETKVSEISNLETLISDGFENLKGDEAPYFSYNSTLSSPSYEVTVNGDGSTNINVYYDRNEYTINFILGQENGSNYRIYTGNSPSSYSSVSTDVTLNAADGNSYTISDGTTYSITAKYGANIAEQWPYPTTDISPESISVRNWFWNTTYYPYGWLYQKQGSSSYVTQVSGVYTMNKDMIESTTSGGVTTYQGTDFYLAWTSSSSNYTVHYMFETIDGSDFVENEAYQTKITSNSMNYKTIDHFYYEGESESASSGNNIYMYYYRNTYKLTFYNVTDTVIPNTSGVTFGEGISQGTDGLDVKYGASLSSLEGITLDSDQYPIQTLGYKDWIFEGWYLDENCTIPVNWNVTMEDDMVVYAKWIPPEYDVTFDVKGGDWNDTDTKYTENSLGEYELVASEGETLTAPVPPTREGYEFKGWYYTNEDGIELEYLFSESQQVYKDLELEAKWEAKSEGTYTVKYVLAQYDSNGNLITDLDQYTDPQYLLPDKVIKNVQYGTTITESAQYVQIDGIDIIVVDQFTKQIEISTNDEENEIVFFYTTQQQMEYEVYYVEDTGVRYENGEVPPEDVQLAPVKTTTVTDLDTLFVTEPSIEIDGYEVDAYKKSMVLVSDGEKNKIYFYYSPVERKGEYEINYFFMKDDLTYPDTPDYVASGEDSVGKYIKAEDYADYLPLTDPLYEGHEYDAETSDVLMIVISSGDKATMNLYFKLKEYTVEYDTQGGEWTETSDIYTEQSEEIYTAIVTHNETAPTPTEPVKENHRFVGWYDEATNQLYDFTTSVTGDVKLYAKWIEQKDILIQKKWTDNENQDGLRAEAVTIHLKADDTVIDTITLTEQDTWMKKIEDLDVTDEEGNVIEYTVEEDEVENYTTTYSIEGNVYTVENIHVPETKPLTIEKVWEDNYDQDGLRPDTIEVKIKNDVEFYKTVTLTKADKWTLTEEVPVYKDGQKLTYSAEELLVTGYETSYLVEEDKITITNTHTPITKDINVTKEWDDNFDQDGVRPYEVTINVKNGDTVVGTVVLNKDNSWNDKVTDLPVYNQGQEISYTMEEETVDGYTPEYVIEGDEFKVINTHEVAKKKITITKEWVDNFNQDGIRPSSINVDLKADGVLVETVNLSDANSWAAEVDNLDVYKDGVLIEYSVEEEMIDGYTTEVTKTGDTYTVVNTHEIEKTSLNIEKKWEDNYNQDGIRPTTVQINILANNQVVRTVELTETDSWKTTVNDLDKYSGGQLIDYQVQENEITSYTSSAEYNEDTNTWVVTNTHIPETIDIIINKSWEDNFDQDGLRPDSITVNLLANGTQTDTLNIKEADNWSGTFKDLPVYSSGEKINYSISEISVDGYTTNVEQNGNTYNVTNTHIPETVDRTVKKIWRDGSNQENTRPDSIRFRLLKNGEEFSEIITLTAENSNGNADEWEYTFNDLDVYENGEKISYTVEEIGVPDGYGVIYDQENLYIYNAYPPEVELAVEKVWDDEDDADGIRPDSVAVQLLADGEPYTIAGNNIGYVVLSDENSWRYEWGFAEKYNSNGEKYEYTLQEVDTGNPNYTSNIKVDDGGNPEYESTFIVTNSYTPQKTSRKVVKIWEDNFNQDNKRPESITIRLHANGEEVASVSLNEENGWEYIFENINLNENGAPIEYTISEDNVPGYSTNIIYDSVDTFTVTNSYTPETQSITIGKAWEDNENQDRIRPGNVFVTLKSNGNTVGKYELSDSNSWNVEINNLPVYESGTKIEYTVEEDAVTGYTPSYSYDSENNKFIVTNTHIPEKRTIDIIKSWDDMGNRDGLRPTNVIVSLKEDGTVIKENIILNKSNSWTTQIADLDKYKDGVEIDYTIEEQVVENYTTSYSYDLENNKITITNSHTPEVKNITIEKIWNDDDDAYNKRPDDILVDILANDSVIETVTLEGEVWSTNVGGLYVRENGKEITYAVKEHENANYTSSVAQEGNNYTITNTIKTFEIVTKVNSVGGTISGDGMEYYEKVTNGDSNTKEIVITPNEGYEISKITINGVEQTLPADPTEEYTLPTITNITEDKEVVAEFSKIEYEITTEVVGGNGTISGEGETPYEIVLHGENNLKDIVITPDEGYQIKSITINGVEYEISLDVTYPYILEQLTNITEDKHIVVEFEKVETKVIVSYITTNGDKIIDDVIIYGELGDTYITKEKEFKDYVLVEKPDNATGIIEQYTTQVTYVYEHRPSIYVTKTVKGSYANLDKQFTLEINLTDKNGNQYVDTTKYKIEDSANNIVYEGEIVNGNGIVTISHGQTITFSSILEGTNYSIKELGAKDYITRINSVVQEDKEITGELVDNTIIDIVNEKEYVAPTGIILSVLPFVLGIAIVIILYIVLRKSKKNRE